MSKQITFIGVVDGAVRLLVQTPQGPLPVALARIEALGLAGQIEAAAEALPGSELPVDPVVMRVSQVGELKTLFPLSGGNR